MKLYGLQEAANHIGAKSKQTIANWIKKGLAHETQQLGKFSIIVIDSDTLDTFAATVDRKPGPKPKPVS